MKPERYPCRVMSLLRRASIETLRVLGINVPTALLAILCMGLTILIAPAPSTPETESVTGLIRWILESTGWFAGVLLVFIPLLILNMLKVARRDRTAEAHRGIIAEITGSVDNQMKSFLRNTLRDPRYGVTTCYVFGSVVGAYPTRDVDVIVQFDSSAQGRVRTCRHRLRDVENDFNEVYNLQLHVQTFLCTENEALDRFLGTAGLYERLI